jgi:2-polyprenyl-3-methyl-5-hydroxy-6-metoxy-1,4-benzoquinol methylase
MTSSDQQRLREAREYWDAAAATFDESPDHGLHDPIVRRAWEEHLARWVSAPRASILDVGCGTGSLSVVLAELGHEVTGIDVSPAMVAQAEAKALAAGQRAGQRARGQAGGPAEGLVTYKVMDAAYPQFAPRRFDVILCRHVLWALSEPAAVLRRWVELLRPGGRLLVVEGFWSTGSGLHSATIVEAVEALPLPASMLGVQVEDLSDQPDLWGGEVHDERYAVIAELRA